VIESIEALRPHLKVAFDWLSSSEQPEGALIQHHGIYLLPDCSPEFSVQIAPETILRNQSIRRTVVIIEHRDKKFVDGAATNVLTEEEFKSFIELVNSFYPVFDHWNGVGCESGSMSVAADVSDGVVRLLATYRGGCPTHKHSLCSWEKCSWFKEGRAKAVLPEGWR